MSTSLCPYCGNPVRVGAAFCPNCGRTLPITQSLIATPLEPGMVLRSRYQIEKRLGKGGAGDVYLARDQQLFNRPVVVKRLRVQETDARNRAEAERNFEREAQALAELNNPRFPQILDFFIEPPLFYLVMEFVAGEGLDNRLENLGGPMSEDDVRSIGLQMAELLVYLHGQNPPIVHRDIKPANIIINNAGQITLVDFGIARAKSKPADGKKGAKADSAAWGTPGYAPPEQVAGRAEPASDIFALGATLHQLVTGRDPRDHVGGPFPPANSLIGAVSLNFTNLLARMVNTDPAQRPTAATLQKELQDLDTMARVAKTSGQLGAFQPVTAPPPPPAQPISAPPAPPPTSGGAGFRFPSGDVAMSLREFAGLADRNWEEARDGLYGGRVARWLRDLGDRNAAADATAIASSEPTPDLGLETFLEHVVPGLTPATLDVAPLQIDAGALRAGGRRRETLRVRNSTRGALRARLRPSAAWITAEPGAVTCRAGESKDVVVTITAPPGGSSQGSIDVDAGAAGRAQVAVSVGGAAASAARSGGLNAGFVIPVIIILLALVVVSFVVLNQLGQSPQPPAPTATSVPASPTPAPLETIPVGGLAPPGPGDWTQPGYDAGHTNAAPQDAGTLTNAKIRAVARSDAGAPPVSAPLVAQGRAIFLLNRVLNVYDIQTGGVGWPVGAAGTGQIVLPGALVLGPGRIFATTSGALIAFDLADGSTVWTQPLSAALTNSLISAVNPDGSQHLYRTTDTVVSTFGADGTPGWSSPDLNAIGTLQGTVADAIHVYVSGERGVVALSPGSGAIQWTTPLTATLLGAPALGPEAVLVQGQLSNTSHVLYALDKSSGAVRWSTPTLLGDLTAPAVQGAMAYVSGEHEVAAYFLTNGQLAWKQDKLDVGGRGDYLLAEPPVVGPRYLYVASNIGRIWALDTTTGLQMGTINLRDKGDRNLELNHNPILSNGRLYVVSNNTPTLYEIGP